MILFYDIVEILDLADGDGGTVLRVVALDRRLIGRTPVDSDLLWHPMTTDRFLEKAERCLLVPLLGKQKVNGLTSLIHGAIEVIPMPFHLNIRLVQAPADPHRALTPMKRLFQLGAIFHDPPL